MRNIILSILLPFIFLPRSLFAVDYPAIVPAGEQAGGWFQTYFDNMYTTPCGVNEFLNGFSLSGTLLCSVPGLYIAGVLGQTLYYDGSNWVATSNIWNDGTNVGIGTAVPGAKLDVNGDARINTVTIGRGSGAIASNTALGFQTFYSNVTGINNVGLGYETLYSNVSGFGNTMAGYRAGRNTTGNNNAAFGFESLFSNISGNNNTAVGVNSMYQNTIGSSNTALGQGALGALTSGNYNIALGYNADVMDPTGSGQLSIGNWIYGSGGKIGIGTGSLDTDAILKVAGQIQITGGSPGTGKVLTTDGNGLASWTGSVTATALNITGSVLGSTMYFDGTDWVASTNVYNAGGNVGIGTPAPGAKLEVNGQIKITGGSVATGRILTTDATGLAYWADPGAATTVAASGVISGTEGYIPFFGTGGNGLYSSLLFQTGGRLGIGTTSPQTNLDIVGQVKISGGSPGTGKVLTSDATGLAAWADPAVASSVYATGVIGAYGSGGYITQFMPFGTGITSSIIFQSGSFIGIGNTNPTYGLDVTGTFRAVSNAVIGGTIQISGGSPGVGKVLVSDASGNASWGIATVSNAYATGILAASSSGGYLTKFIANGSGITSSFAFESGSYIGIGTTSPIANLDISGSLRTSGNTTILGTANISGASTLSSTLGVAGATTLQSNLTTQGNTSLQGVLGVTGATTLSSTLGVAGATTLQSNLTTQGNTSLQGVLGVTGATILGSTIQILGGSPGLGKVLMSDATGLASWTSFVSGATATGITGGASGYLSVFGTGGNGLYSSLLFQTGSRIGIGTATPGTMLDVNGTFRAVGASTLSSTLGVVGVTTLGSTLTVAGGTSLQGVLGVTGATTLSSTLDVTGNTDLGSTLTVAGGTSLQGVLGVTGATILGSTIQILGGSPGLGKVLMSDATGLASWTSFVSGATATGITGGASGYLSVFGTGGNGLYSSLLFQTGSRIGIGTAAPGTMLDVNGTFRAVGASTLSSTLGVVGVTTLGSTLTVAGGTSLQGVLGVTGATILGSTLQILGGSPGLGKVLTSDATGLASWASGTVTIDNVLGGTQGYITRFATGGTGIMNSSLFETGGRIAIGSTNPSATFQVTGSGLYSGDLTVQGKLITDTIINRSVANVSISGSILPDTAAPLTYRDIGNDTTGSWNNLYLSGQIKIKGGTPGAGRVLMSDANGLATWSPFVSGATATGITGGASGYLSVFGAGGNGLYSSLLFQTGTRIGIGNATPSYTLDVTGTGNFVGLRLPTGAANGYILTSDASGNARWLTGFSGSTTASGITGGTEGYITRFGTGGNGLTNSLIFQSGTRMAIGTGTTYSGYILNIDSGISNISGIRFARVSNATPVYTAGPTNPLGVNSSGELVPVQGGMIPVYTALGASPASAVNTSVDPPTIGADYDKYFTIPARQSFTVTDVGGNPYNCPEFQIGATNKGATGCSQTPWASYVMTAQNATTGNRYAYQILISDRTDAPFVVRGGMYSSATGTLMNTAMTIPALWFKAITVPTNRSDWFYINPGVDQNNNPISGGGNIGIGLTGALSKFEIWTGSSVAPLMHFRGVENIGLGLNGTNPAVSGSRNVGIGRYALSGVTSGSRNIGIGSLAGSNITSGSNNIMIGSGVQIANAGWSSQLNIGDWIFGSGGKIGIGTGSLATNAILKVGGQIEITGGSPGAGKVLISDANGLASWSSSFSGATATGITGGTQNYLPKFGTGGTGLYISQIIDTGTGIGVGATGGTITTKFVIDSGVDDDSGLRLSRLDVNTPLTSNGVLALGINGSGKVLPISPISNIAVYTGVLRTTALSPNPDLNTFDITYNFNQYFAIPGKQSFVVSKGDGPSYNGPYFKENGTSALCSITGTYGTSPYDCIDPDPVTGISASPYNSFTMTAKGDTFGYQLALGARGDAPLFARSGRFNGSQTGGLYTNDSPYQTPAPWQRVLSLPANHPEYLYINTGLNSQLQSQTGAGNIGVGTTVPNSRFEIWTGATTQTLLHFRGRENIGLGLNSLDILVSGSRNVGIGTHVLNVITSGGENVALGYYAASGVTTGGRNVVLGSNAGSTLTTGSGNIIIGSGANVFAGTGSNQLSIGNWIYGSGGFISIGGVSNPSSNFEVWSGSVSTLIHFRGTDNVGFGLNAARHQASGTANSAFGDDALRTTTTGYSNTALGWASLYSNQTGFFNTAGGTQALYTNSDGTWNVALGSQALYTNLGGDYNVALGGQSLYLNSSGDNNVAIGYLALRATTNGTNIGIGSEAGSGITTGTGNIMIGYRVQANSNTSSNQLNIGNWIYGSGGNIGIGVANPSVKLDINGQIKISGGSPGAGKVLTSDASGVATWQTPSGTGGGGGGLSGGQTDYVGRWTSSTTLGTGALTDNGTNVGIGTSSPGANLGVNGTFRLGTNGTALNSIIKATVVKDVPSISGSTCSAQTFTLTGATTSGTAFISPASALNDRMIIAYTRVSASNTVEAKFCNESGGNINLASMNYYVTVIQ